MFVPSSKAVVVALCLVLCLSGSALAAKKKKLPEALANCQAKASTKGFVFGKGKLTASSSANCEALAASVSDVEEIAEEFYLEVEKNPDETCNSVEIEKFADKCGVAMASAYASVAGEVSIVGNGKGCAGGFSFADAYASAFAGAIIDIWVGLSDGENTADGDALVGGLTAAIAEVWASAVTEACQEGEGFASDFQSGYAEQISQAIVSAFARVALSLCSEAGVDSADVKALADSFVNVDVDVQTTTVVDGTAGAAEDTELDVCEKKVAKTCCKGPNSKKPFCLVKKNVYRQRTNGIWEKDGKKCFCNILG